MKRTGGSMAGYEQFEPLALELRPSARTEAHG
jgi:hypothetical protein